MPGVDTKISADPDAGALAGTETVPVVTGGVNKKTTTQAIANLAPPTTIPTASIRRLTIITDATTARTLSATDIWGHIRFTNGGAITLTVDTSHGFSTGDRVRITAAGAGQVTVVASGTTLNSRGGALKSAGQYAVFELECVGTNAFDVLGDVTT